MVAEDVLVDSQDGRGRHRGPRHGFHRAGHRQGGAGDAGEALDQAGDAFRPHHRPAGPGREDRAGQGIRHRAEHEVAGIEVARWHGGQHDDPVSSAAEDGADVAIGQGFPGCVHRFHRPRGDRPVVGGVLVAVGAVAEIDALGGDRAVEQFVPIGALQRHGAPAAVLGHALAEQRGEDDVFLHHVLRRPRGIGGGVAALDADAAVLRAGGDAQGEVVAAARRLLDAVGEEARLGGGFRGFAWRGCGLARGVFDLGQPDAELGIGGGEGRASRFRRGQFFAEQARQRSAVLAVVAHRAGAGTADEPVLSDRFERQRGLVGPGAGALDIGADDQLAGAVELDPFEVPDGGFVRVGLRPGQRGPVEIRFP